MKKHLRITSLALLVAMLLSMTAGAVHNKTTWLTLNQAGTFLEPYVDYESLIDKTEQTYRFSDYAADLQTLQAQYPDLMRLEIIGYSELGRPLYVVVMGKDSAPNRTFVMANTHAREYITSQLCMLQIEFYLKNYYNTIDGERVCDLMERCQFYFLPMHNPDGAQLAMFGLDSLDAPEVTIDSTEKAQIEKFLVSQVKGMNKYCEANKMYHDTDADLYTQNPDPERDDAFQYWKSNIRGIDLHNSMYDTEMKKMWGGVNLNAYNNYPNPAWTDYLGTRATAEGISLSKENTALNDYVTKIQPNVFLSYHTVTGNVQWDSGYTNLGGEAIRKNAMKISYKVGELLNYPLDEKTYMLMGHHCWFMQETLAYMDKPGYGTVIEFADRRYLDSYTEEMAGYIDAPPSKVIQLADDVKDINGTQRYSLWTTGKFFPLSISQYIIDNRLIEPVEPLSTTVADGTDMVSILGTKVSAPTTAGDIQNFGTYQCKVEDKTSIVTGDILTSGKAVRLMDANFSKQQDSIAINGTTQVNFTYINSMGVETKATFTVTPYPTTLAFTDLTPGETFYDDIRWVFANGLMNGKTETTFDRKSNLTRQQVWRVMSRA
ncbi:MAG: hypothetical protein E7429_00005, partial [Ruminococcaceae bacterium]|nr:hypothetical protein [Oscillospiraceae bacterium]